jgi:hypothetical protein
MHLETGADQFRALSHELKAEVAPAASGHCSNIEPATVVTDGQDPVCTLDRTGDRRSRRRTVLPDILQCFLQDAQHDRLAAPVDRRKKSAEQ